MASKIKILIAEDHDIVRKGLKILIQADPEMRVAAEADNGRDAVKLARSIKPDVILMDVVMPGMGGVEATRAIAKNAPGSKVLALSSYGEEACIQDMLHAGAKGYLTKHSASDDLLEAIRRVNHGEHYFSPAIKRRHQAELRQAFSKGHPAIERHLTPREQEVLKLIAQGMPNKQIAATLSLSQKTIEKHRQKVMDKLNIHETAGLTRHAINNGIV